jgi:hypothetical protein
MTPQELIKNPFEDLIVKGVAEKVAEEMIAEIRDEVAIWVEKLPITSPQVRSTDITKAFQERLALQLAVRQGQTEQLALGRKRVLEQIPTGRVHEKILAIETRAALEGEVDFRAHVLQCAELASEIVVEKFAFEREEGAIVERVEREMGIVLRRDREMWMEMGTVSWVEFEKEWEGQFGNA